MNRPEKGCYPFDTNFISPTAPTAWTTLTRPAGRVSPWVSKAGETDSAIRSLSGSFVHTPEIPAQALILFLSLANFSAAVKLM